MKQENKEGDIRSIYREYVEDVFRFVAVFTANNEEAEDVTQEVFIRLFDSLPKFKGHSSLKTWIFSIARNVAIDYVKKQKKQLFLQDYVLQFLPAKGKSTEEIIEAKEEERTVHEGLRKLKPDHKLVILLRGIHEFSVKETSKITGWTEAKVKVTYHRALKELKLTLERDVACEFTRRVHNE